MKHVKKISHTAKKTYPRPISRDQKREVKYRTWTR